LELKVNYSIKVVIRSKYLTLKKIDTHDHAKSEIMHNLKLIIKTIMYR